MADSIDTQLSDASAALGRLETEIRKAYIGQPNLVRGVLIGLISQGNLLLEGAPGLGKTLLVRVLAQALELDFSRIQFTPDLMPADITGGPTLHRTSDGATELAFRPGPVFTHILLADEINRGTPRTQSALLEAMQERSVTVGGQQHVLEAPFLVIATQNPIEMEGTYPLPEAQLDRFLLKLLVEYPTPEVLVRIGLETTSHREPEVQPVLNRDTLLGIQRLAQQIVVGDQVAGLAARITLATHPKTADSPEMVKKYVRFGASPRAMQALIQAGRARALLEGRAFVSPEDLKAVCPDILRHRIFVGFEAGLEGIDTDDVVTSVVKEIL